MKEYSDKISLIKNSRGVYCLDTSIGCNSGMSNEAGGCYNDCYAAKSAKLYGYNFNKTVLRNFTDENHRRFIVRQINKIKLDFVRIGCSGDPSEDWEHTINILKKIDKCNKQIVIITRHWTQFPEEHLEYLKTINICINTSISALDKSELLQSCLNEYIRFKPYCKSILRIVSADFNLNNVNGKEFSVIQNKLFKNEDVLDTVLRVNKNNELLKQNIINVNKTSFLNKNTLASKFKKSTYLGHCSTCHEMCGVNIEVKNKVYPNKPGIIKQLLIPFKKSKLIFKMEYLTNDIIKFKNLDGKLNGVIKAVLDKVYYVHGFDGKEYKISKSDIVESIGKAKVNEVRSKAEEWQREK